MIETINGRTLSEVRRHDLAKLLVAVLLFINWLFFCVDRAPVESHQDVVVAITSQPGQKRVPSASGGTSISGAVGGATAGVGAGAGAGAVAAGAAAAGAVANATATPAAPVTATTATDTAASSSAASTPTATPSTPSDTTAAAATTPATSTTNAATAATAATAAAATAATTATPSPSTPPAATPTPSPAMIAWADGRVTLSGTVRDDAARTEVLARAAQAAGGADKVIDRLTIDGAAAPPSMTLSGEAESEAQHQAWLQAARTMFGADAAIVDRIVVRGGVSTPSASGTVTAAAPPTGTSGASAASAPAAAASPEVDVAPDALVGAGYPEMISFFFDTAKTTLPADARAQLQSVITYASAQGDARIGISGYHDRHGNAAANIELAKNRARVTRDLLVAAGVPADRIVMVKPRESVGGSDDRAARRVDVYPAR